MSFGENKWRKSSTNCVLVLFISLGIVQFTFGQNYEVADIDCAVGTNGKELLSARLRKPDGFRGNPIFADDRGASLSGEVSLDLTKDAPCQIFPDPTDSTGRVYVLRVGDFSQCGVLKRNGFIHVRVWFPQLQGVVMLSDQEVIIMCKPPQPTVTQSKAAGFAGSIPTGARVSGVVEESPGRLEYEVALFRETSSSNNVGRSSVPGGPGGTGTFITSMDSQELPVDQAVPIGTRLQLRAKISLDSAWQHAKLMEVSVSPDPKDPNAEGSVSLVKDGCRNSDLVSIIPKQPYRYKDRPNEVVLDFEAFLLSNMGERNTLWLHTQIKACMESQDCTPEFCMDVYQPSGFGRRRRESELSSTIMLNSTVQSTPSNITGMEYTAPLAQHWKAFEGPAVTVNDSDSHKRFIELPKNPLEFPLTNKNEIPSQKLSRFSSKTNSITEKSTNSTKFGDNIGFSVIMPADYYRTNKIGLSASYECRGWALATMVTLFAALTAAIISCVLSCRLKKLASDKEKILFCDRQTVPCHQTPISVVRANPESSVNFEQCKKNGIGHHHHHHQKYARDSSVHRP